MRIGRLVAGLGELAGPWNTDTAITHITHDSRRVQPDGLFVALRGARVDGLTFVPEALARGAAGIVCGLNANLDPQVPQCWVAHPRKAMAELARRLYHDPDEDLQVVGVTGTNGKTTVCYLIQHLLVESGMACGVIGTLGCYDGRQNLPGARTTPESDHLYEWLSAMRGHGCVSATVEISSHALAQFRVHGLKLACGVWTNLSQDHLDYHSDMRTYRETKAKMLAQVRSGGSVVLNADDDYVKKIRIPPALRVVRVGQNPESEIRFQIRRVHDRGMELLVHTRDLALPVQTALHGMHNAYNVTMALAAVSSMGMDLAAAAAHVPFFSGVRGRMEVVDVDRPFMVIVDYAHTPDALDKALQACHEMCRGKVILVFGAGGDRDATKRPLMGCAADQGADHIVLTSDNPRSENPERIMDDVQQGMARIPGHGLDREPDRRTAIARALKLARKGDLVLIAGKGHENTQEIMGERHAFDDRETVFSLLENGGDTHA